MRNPIVFLVALAATAASSLLSAAPIRSSLGGDGEEYIDAAAPTAADYIHDGLVLCLDAIENVAMGVSDHTVPYVFNIAPGGVYFRLDSVTFDEETASFSRPQKYLSALTDDSVCSPFRNLNATVEYFAAYTTTGYDNGWGCGVNPTTNGWSYVFISSRYNILQVSQEGSFVADALTPSQKHHSTIVIDGKTMFSYCEGEYDKQKNFMSEGYQYCNQFGFSTIPRYSNSAVSGMRCFRLYNRALSEEEIAWNYKIDLARFGEGE